MNSSERRLKFKESCLKQEHKALFTPNNVINLSIVYELDGWSRDLNTDFTLKDCLKLKLLIQMNANLADTVWDLIRVQNFYYLMVAWEKMSLFLELI